MGNREALLAAAKRCLYDKGYARTTARDIATEAGTSLAAIGYHYKSTEALMNAAVTEAIHDWGAELARALAANGAPDAGPIERFEIVWARFVESFKTQSRLWAASLEVAAHVDHVPEVRQGLAANLEQGRLGLAQLFLGMEPADDLPKARAVGSFYQALVSGMVVQWVIDPEHAPSSRDLTDALRTIVARAGEAADAKAGGKS